MELVRIAFSDNIKIRRILKNIVMYPISGIIFWLHPDILMRNVTALGFRPYTHIRVILLDPIDKIVIVIVLTPT